MTEDHAAAAMGILIQTPITGCEALTNLSNPVRALAEFYRAFNTRDLALMAENWANSADISMDDPRGGINRCWRDIRALYERIFAGPGRVYVAFFDYTLHRADELFHAVGRERGRFEANGRGLDLTIRTSGVFRTIGGRWRQVHHRGSFEDACLLAAYKRAVRADAEGATS